MIAGPKMASSHHLTHEPFSVRSQQVPQVPSLAASLSASVRTVSSTHSRDLLDRSLSAVFYFEQTSPPCSVPLAGPRTCCAGAPGKVGWAWRSCAGQERDTIAPIPSATVFRQVERTGGHVSSASPSRAPRRSSPCSPPPAALSPSGGAPLPGRSSHGRAPRPHPGVGARPAARRCAGSQRKTGPHEGNRSICYLGI